MRTYTDVGSEAFFRKNQNYFGAQGVVSDSGSVVVYTLMGRNRISHVCCLIFCPSVNVYHRIYDSELLTFH